MTAVWINQIIQGVMLGGLYTLFAIGLSLCSRDALRQYRAWRFHRAHLLCTSSAHVAAWP
jgi:hypothetical protein